MHFREWIPPWLITSIRYSIPVLSAAIWIVLSESDRLNMTCSCDQTPILKGICSGITSRLGAHQKRRWGWTSVTWAETRLFTRRYNIFQNEDRTWDHMCFPSKNSKNSASNGLKMDLICRFRLPNSDTPSFTTRHGSDSIGDCHLVLNSSTLTICSMLLTVSLTLIVNCSMISTRLKQRPKIWVFCKDQPTAKHLWGLIFQCYP